MVTEESDRMVPAGTLSAHLLDARDAYGRCLAEQAGDRRRDGPERAREATQRAAAEFMVDMGVPLRPAGDLARSYAQCRQEVFSARLGEVPTSTLIRMAEVTAMACVHVDLKTAQIRRFYGSVQRLASKIRLIEHAKFDKSEIELLKVPLAYAAGRQDKAREFVRTCIAALDAIRPAGEEGYRDWERFRRFVEAVIAYHKFYGGKEDEPGG